jgi:hypothetical protein
MNKLPTLAACATLLTGCANWNSIHHDFRPDSGDSLAIDANQRVVYTVTKKYGKDVEWKAFCAEPSPDALSALSASLGLDVAVASKAIGAAFASQEAAASIGLRTQTIQTLRDGMYRLCEGYASGALDDTGFARLQRRYQAIMLGLLAIEQLTGAVVANQAVLNGSAGAKLGQSLSHITVLVNETRSKSIAAKNDLTAKTAAADTALAEKTKAEDALKAATDKATGVGAATAALKEKSDAAEKADAAKKKAALEEATQAAELANLESLRKDLDRATAIAATSGSLVAVSTAAKGPPDSAAFVQAADTIKEIVTTIVEHDYTKETCMDAMTSQSARSLHTVEQVDLLELQLNYCAFAMQDKAANAGARQTKSGALSPAALKSVAEAAVKFTEKSSVLLQTRRVAIEAANAASAAERAQKK